MGGGGGGGGGGGVDIINLNADSLCLLSCDTNNRILEHIYFLDMA